MRVRALLVTAIVAIAAIVLGIGVWVRSSNGRREPQAVAPQNLDEKLASLERKLDRLADRRQPEGANAAVAARLDAIERELHQAHGVRADGSAVPTAPAPPSERQQRAGEAATSIVERSIGAGRWSAEDRRRLRELLPEMGEDERLQLTKRLIVEVNEGRVRPEIRGPLF